MGRLTEDLLDAAQLDAGTFSVEPRRGPLLPMLMDCVADLSDAARARGLALALEAPDGLPELAVDLHRLRQVLDNLVGNALGFTPAGQVTVRAQAGPGEVRITAEDSGPGIPPAELGRVFDRFWQGRGHPRASAGPRPVHCAGHRGGARRDHPDGERARGRRGADLHAAGLSG